MTVDITFLGAVAPEYANFDETRFGILLPIAQSFVNYDLWGDSADYGVALMLAHMIKMSEREGQSGAVSSEKIGNYSANYAHNLQKNEELKATSYGLEFLRVRKTLPIVPFVAE